MPSLKVLAALLSLAAPALAEGLAEPLTATPGDAARGRVIIADRSRGLCLLCHSGPFPEERFQGNLAPSLAGAGARLTAPELRLRLVDSRQVNPDSIMPAYFRADGLHRVAPALHGRTLLQAQEVEDVLAFLLTLREENP